MDAKSPNLIQSWHLVPVHQVEDLQDAVLDAGLETTQLSRGRMEGSLAFAQIDDMVLSSGLIGGRLALTGPLSKKHTTLGVGIHMAEGCLQWLHETPTGAVGVFRAGETHEAVHATGTLYACLTIPDDRLEHAAAERGLVLDSHQLGASRITANRLEPWRLRVLHRMFAGIHRGYGQDEFSVEDAGQFLLESLILHLARLPIASPGPRYEGVPARIVSRAREYILENLKEHLSIHDIAQAAFVSPSTLHRAFHEVLGETPSSYVRKLRLNRIRQALASGEQSHRTIAALCHEWGIGEAGRLSGWYRDLFGERPSDSRHGPST